MKCTEARERMFEGNAEEHAAMCASCAALRRTIQAEGRLLSSAPQTPADLWSRIQVAVRTAPQRPSRMGWLAAAAAILTAVVGFFLFGSTESRAEPTLNLVVVDASPEASQTFTGMVPGYEDASEERD